MAYNITIKMRQYKYQTWRNVLVWCHGHLQVMKDFSYSDEQVQVGGSLYPWPEYFYLRQEEDLVAMKLAVKLE